MFYKNFQLPWPLTVHVEKVKEEKAGEYEESEAPESEESADVAPKKEAGSQ